MMNNLSSGILCSLTGAAAVASLASCATGKQKEEQKPLNIVYIMTDDHTAQMMSCYDTRYMETPNLDRIARDGVRFTNSFVANSLSGPSRACMITSFMTILPACSTVPSKLSRNCFRRPAIKLHS